MTEMYAFSWNFCSSNYVKHEYPESDYCKSQSAITYSFVRMMAVDTMTACIGVSEITSSVPTSTLPLGLSQPLGVTKV